MSVTVVDQSPGTSLPQKEVGGRKEVLKNWAKKAYTVKLPLDAFCCA